MARLREIKRRIRSVDNTKQITKTMEMVAAAKIRRAQERIEAARPYALTMMNVLDNVGARVNVGKHPLLEIREPKKQTIIIPMTSDRGLCGAFNTNIIRRTEKLAESERSDGSHVSIFAVGKKGINYFKYVGYDFVGEKKEISDSPTYADAKDIASDLIKRYIEKSLDKVVVVFNHFKSAMEQKAIEHVLLPIKRQSVEAEENEPSADYIFEPEDSEVLNHLLPAYVEALVYRALMESAASEHGARRTAMKSATDNAIDMIAHLTRSFNRARQAQITQEISEIVGGAEALKDSLEAEQV